MLLFPRNIIQHNPLQCNAISTFTDTVCIRASTCLNHHVTTTEGFHNITEKYKSTKCQIKIDIRSPTNVVVCRLLSEEDVLQQPLWNPSTS